MSRWLLNVTWLEGTGDGFSSAFPDFVGLSIGLTLPYQEEAGEPIMTSLDPLAARVPDAAFLQPMRGNMREIWEDGTRPPIWCMTTAVSKAVQTHYAFHSKDTFYYHNSWGTWNILHLLWSMHPSTIHPSTHTSSHASTHPPIHLSVVSGVGAGACILCEIVPGAWTCFFDHWWLFWY